MASNKKNVTVIDVEDLTITSPKMYLVSIKGMDSILFNRQLNAGGVRKTEKKNQAKVDPDEMEHLIWRERVYCDDNGMLYLPGENIHECLKQGSQYWGQKIPGEGNKTYTDVVASAIICENMDLGIHRDSEGIIPFGKMVNGNPSKGKKSGTKVYRIRPLLRPWDGTFKMHVFDGRLSKPILKTVVAYAGSFRGLGDWRPTYGRFDLIEIKEV